MKRFKIKIEIIPDKSDNKFLEIVMVSCVDFLITSNTNAITMSAFE